MDMVGILQRLLEQIILFVPQIFKGLAIIAVSLPLSNVAARWTRRTAKMSVEDPEIQRLLTRLARWSVVVLGTLLALNQVINVTSLLAGLGVLGFTIGFALQDIARNFIAGLLLLFRQPFEIGDAVEIAGHTGTVLDITMRDTVIKTWDGVMEILPNMDVFTNPIVNYSKLPLRRRTIEIGLGYGQDVEGARRVFQEAIRGVDGVQEDPAPNIFVQELGDSALNLAARFWVNQETHGLLDVHSAVVQAINEIAEREGIELPYPVRTVQLVGDWPASAP